MNNQSKTFIENLQKERSEFGNPRQAAMMANLLDIASKDIYSEGERFVFEMIQNADDAAINSGNEVVFYFTQDCLVVSHNGQPFTEKDVDAITFAGGSTKGADDSKTGYKGIGFKSVFGRSKRVSIFSQNFSFRFDKEYNPKGSPWQSIPIWTEVNDLPTSVQTYIQQATYQVSTIIELPNAKSLLQDLKMILGDGQLLLFLRRTTRIEVKEEGNLVYSVEKNPGQQTTAYQLINLVTSKGERNQWLVKNFDGLPVPQATREQMAEDQGTPEKLKGAQRTEIAFAAKLEKGSLKALEPQLSLLYTYLPTKVAAFGFPVLVNGSFLTNASRESLHEDSVWNEFLFQLVGEKMAQWVALLAESTYKLQILQLLPQKFGQTNHRLISAFDKHFWTQLIHQNWIPTESGILRQPAYVLWDRTNLSQQSFIEREVITAFIHEQGGIQYSADAFVHPELEQPQKLKLIGVQVFELDNMESFFRSHAFILRHNPEQNFSLITYLKQKSDDDKQGIWFQQLKTLPFIFSDNGRLYRPEKGICFPTAPSTTSGGDVPLIHPTVFAQIERSQQIWEWLSKLGVKEPSDVAYVTNVLIPSLRKGNFINNDNYLTVTRYLYRLHWDKELDEEMLEGLRELPLKTKGETGTFVQAQACFLSNFYQPKLKIEGIIPDVPLVDESYVQSGTDPLQWHLFFRALKVKQDVEVEFINNNNDLSTLRRLTNAAWVNEVAGKAKTKGGFGFGEHNEIKETRLPSFVNLVSTNLPYAKLFWNVVLSNPSIFSEVMKEASFRYGEGRGHNSFVHKVENYFSWFIRNIPCLPTTNKEIKAARETYANYNEIKQIAGDYLPVFDTEATLSSDWLGQLKLKTSLELSDYLAILEFVAADVEEDGTVKKSNRKRIGMIYQKVVNMISDLGDDKKQIIREWGKTVSLLSTDGTFSEPATLNWIKEQAFQIEAHKLKQLALPDSGVAFAPAFPEFMNLLGITTIDRFTPAFENMQEDYSLKQKLAQVLPFWVAILKKRDHVEAREEFNRLYDIIDDLRFYSTSKIMLSFDHGGETIEGPNLLVFEENNNIYYKGRWQSNMIMHELLPKLFNRLESLGSREEFSLLLNLDLQEITEWMQLKGFDTSLLLPIRHFSVHQPRMSPSNFVTSEQPISKQEVSTDHLNEANTKVSLVNDHTISPPSSFIAVTSPAAVNITTVAVSHKLYDDLTVIEIPQATNIMLQSEEDRSKVGRWSEEFVYHYLKGRNDIYTEVVWENEAGESGKPYDFQILENGITKWVDVKGTPSYTKDLVHLSGPEWKFMLERGASYSLLRVYGAGSDQPRLEWSDNPAQKLLEGQVIPSEVWLKI